MYLEYKNTGITMNQFLDLIKEKYSHKKYAFTARLDPMARGIVPILVDDECKDINNYLKSKKIYNVKIILGILTDSDDPLGIIEKIQLIDNFEDFLKNFTDKFIIQNKVIKQKFHYFSTKAICMRNQNKNEDSFHDVELINSQILSTGFINFSELKEEIIKNIKTIDITKDFRQKQTIEQWSKLDFDKLPYIELELKVSSGFFVRQFVRDISIELNQPMFAYDIYRKSVF
jgi:tRNA U55 pseudouridine synthase TruB